MSFPDLNGGALAPVVDEYETTVLEVIGEIPEGLHGTLIRNGPNPFSGHFEGTDVLDWWPEAAMLHGISFCHGRVVGYKNRWVETQNRADYLGVETATSYVNSNPNVNVVSHAGEIMALAEGGPPVVIDADLNTLGASVLHPCLASGVTAHPKLDMKTGEMMCFRADWSTPYLRYGVLDKNGNQVVDLELDVPEPSMMHDMAITARHSILMDLNVAYDFSMLAEGYRIPICWQERRTSQLCVVARDGASVAWFEIAPCFIQHVVNAFEQPPNVLTLDVVRYPWYLKRESNGNRFLPNPLGVLWRYTIDLSEGKVTEQQLDDEYIELPRINDAYVGCENKFLYAVVQPTNEEMRGIVCYNLDSGDKQHHEVAPGDQNSEPVFVGHGSDAAENVGWVLVCVYRQSSDTSELRILDATDISQPPLATIVLNRRIPAGFHGAWIPGA